MPWLSGLCSHKAPSRRAVSRSMAAYLRGAEAHSDLQCKVLSPLEKAVFQHTHPTITLTGACSSRLMTTRNPDMNHRRRVFVMVMKNLRLMPPGFKVNSKIMEAFLHKEVRLVKTEEGSRHTWVHTKKTISHQEAEEERRSSPRASNWWTLGLTI